MNDLGKPAPELVAPDRHAVLYPLDESQPQAGEALRKSEQRYRSLFENMLNGFAFCQMHFEHETPVDFTYLEVNQAFENLTGLKNVTGKRVSEVIPGFRAADPELFEIYGRVAMTGVPERFERYVVALEAWFLVSVYSSQKGHFIAVFDVITERKQAEVKLRRTVDRLALAQQSAGSGVWDWDIVSGHIEWTPEFFRLFGLNSSEETASFETWRRVVHPADLVQAERHIEIAVRDKIPLLNEYRIIRPDGQVCWIEAKGLTYYDESGHPLRMTGICLDVTERKRAESDFRQLALRHEAILSEIPDIVMEVDINKIYTWANPAGYEFFGDDVIGKEAACYFVGEQDTYAKVQPLFNGNQGTFYVESWQRRKDGEHRLLAWWCRMLKDDLGQVSGAISTGHDITEKWRAEEDRRKMDAHLQQIQKLESLGILAGGIAHDFNNMLMAILGNADLALYGLSPVSPIRPMLEEVVRASMRAADLCKQMLAYSGKGRFVVKPVNLSEVVEEMFNILEVAISKRVVMRLNLAKNLPAIEADTTQLRQIVLNLIINASEAIGEKSGVISITTGLMACDRRYLREVQLQQEIPEGDYVYLEVADTGCGMNQATQERIFDPFFTTKFTGRGLGLAAVQGIMRGHKGALKLYSEVGKGSTFKMLFPATAMTPEALTAEQAATEGWRGHGVVLVADDEEDVRLFCRRALEHLGFQTLLAVDGQQALEIFCTQPDKITLVLLDLTMPHLDGEETFRELRRIDSHVRVIMSSGYNEQEVVNRFAGKGLAGFIQKPYTLAALVKVLSATLDAQGR